MDTNNTQMFSVLYEIKKKNIFFPKLIVDIGACTGTNGLYGLFTDPEPTYLLIEPLTEFNPVLAKHMGSKSYKIVNCCLSSQSGSALFKVDKFMKDSSCIVMSDTSRTTLNREIITVPVDTIDSVIYKTFPDLQKSSVDIIIKIDVQGQEPEVIEGGQRTITENKCLLIVEVGTGRKNAIRIFSLLESFGYSLVDCIDFVKFPGTTKVTSQFDAIFMLN